MRPVRGAPQLDSPRTIEHRPLVTLALDADLPHLIDQATPRPGARDLRDLRDLPVVRR